MFSYEEFAEGVRNFQVQNSKEKDKDYEVARSENEKAVINLSRTSDPRELAVILTYFRSLLDEVKEMPITMYEDCIKMSALFTYYKILGQHCQLAITQLDDIYQKINVDYTLSSGGLIFILKPYEHQPYLPSVRVKVPITSSPGKVRTTIHEAFIAMVALNPLRKLIPTFSFLFSFWYCGHVMYSSTTTLSGLCDIEGTKPVIIYENNPGSIPLVKYVQSSNLISILSFLLQLMGALEMAHRYSDYTHYDLHSGNVLVQKLENKIDINFGDYALTTDERIIIIDNGMAFCKYERPAVLAPLRKNKSQFENINSVQIFLPEGGVGVGQHQADIERLQSTRINNYGSIQNGTIGVDYRRSYPLGDVFRIFFDIYSLCSADLREDLRPLVKYFFRDKDISSIIHGSSRRHTSSMMNSFSLPPFREDFYSFRYRDFSNVILQKYSKKISGNLVTRRFDEEKIYRVLPPPPPGIAIRLEEAFNWREINPIFIPNLYDIGITAFLNEEFATALANRRELIETVDQTLKIHYQYQRNFFDKLLIETGWMKFKPFEMTLEMMLNKNFFENFLSIIEKCVNLVQWVRVLYSMTSVLCKGLQIQGVEYPKKVLAEYLRVEEEDLDTLATYCRKKNLRGSAARAFARMQKLADEMQIVMSKTKIPKVITKKNSLINWYRLCLPAVRIHLEFGLEWGKVPASFGELSLPSIQDD